MKEAAWDYYEGDWKKGKVAGWGKFVWKSGKEYTGQLKDELSHGIGKCTFGKESVFDYYEGEWKKGKKSGQGKLVWKNGQVYEGRFENDQRID